MITGKIYVGISPKKSLDSISAQHTEVKFKTFVINMDVIIKHPKPTSWVKSKE